MGGDKGARREARLAREAEEKREKRIKMGTADIRSRFGQAFGEDYYTGPEGLETKAKAYYKPQLEDQYAEALKQLQFAMARTGLLNSGSRSMKEAKALKTFNEGEISIAERARGLSNQRRQDVASAEQGAVSQLQASADPAAAAAQASNLIAANSAMPEFQPLGQVFTDFTAGLATQGNLERQGRNRYNVGISNVGNNLRRYTQNIRG